MAKKIDINTARKHVEKAFEDSVIKTLLEYVSIPNASPAFDPEWATNGLLDKAADLLMNWVKSQNVPTLQIEKIKLEGRTPLLYATVDAHESKETCLLYGHLDKQPPLTESWAEGLHPYKPVIKDGKLYGRGGADDGYAIFAAITAIKAVKEQNLPLPRCVIVIEASEESDEADLIAYIHHLKARIGTPSLVVCLDSGCGDYEHFWLTTSLRGVLIGQLNVKILKEAVHSGQASGIVPSSFRIIRQLLDRIEDPKTGKVLVPELAPEIPEVRVQQQRDYAAIVGDLVTGEFPWIEGAGNHEDRVELLLNRCWRPTVSYTGVGGMPDLKSAGNVLRTDTTLTLSVRLPPHADTKAATAALKKTLEKDPPYGAKVTFHTDGDAAAGWASPIFADWLEEVVGEASQSVFGKKHAYVGEGGSIPFMGFLGEQYPKAQFVITGVLGPGSNAHGPNEFLDIKMTQQVTTVVSAILVRHAQL